MTLYLWDASHYDGTLTRAILARAKAEGISGLTHKIGEGIGGDDPEDATALAAGRDVGMEALGGYHVVRSGPVAPQVDALLGLANRDEPWWTSFPGWLWQADLERWSYDNVPASTGIAFAKLLRERTQRQVFLYASHGQYGSELRDWDGPIWNADYVSRPAAGFVAMYPGDDWQPLHSGTWRGGWAPYPSKTPADPPVFLQYTSSAVIAGLTTCDANAYRGTREQLLALINPALAATPIGDTMALDSHGRTLASLGGYDRALERNTHNRLQALLAFDNSAVGISDCDERELGSTRWDLTEPNKLAAVVRQIAADVAAIKAAQGALTDAQVAAEADRIAAALIASPRNALTDADHAAIKTDLVAVLNSKLQAAAGA